MPLKDNPTAQEAADYFAETPQHEIRRHKIHIKCLKEVRKKDIQKIAKLESINIDLLNALEIAQSAVEYMAEATDSDPEDQERLEIVKKAVDEAKEN